MPFHLKNVLSRCKFHIGTTLVGALSNMKVRPKMVLQGLIILGV
jgi:hypothetical protein